MQGRPELPVLVSIRGGVFTMGRESIAEAEAPNPPHEIELDDFAIGLFPVTVAEYAVFAKTSGMTVDAALLAHPRRPMVNVSYEDALAYARWAGGSLPTEAQWELAARGFDGRCYPWGEEPPDEARACFALDWNRGGPCEVGARPSGASPFGCEELAGNVWEWCLDPFFPEAHTRRAKRGDGLVEGTSRVRPLRGGCWRSIDCKLQAAYRNWSHEVARHTTIGFRISATIEDR